MVFMARLKIAIIGCGNMGGAIARSVVKNRVARPIDISLNDKDIRKARALSMATGARVISGPEKALFSDILIISVKPQDFFELAGHIKGKLTAKTVISVMAGKSIKDIRTALVPGKGKGKFDIVRAMPNMPALIGEGMTCIAYRGKPAHIGKVREIFESVGKLIELDEKHLDAVTAISGSGPAYLFYLADAMVEAGRSLGLDALTAGELVMQTLYGASTLLKLGKESPADLILKVASKKGTTEAALSLLKEQGVKSFVVKAIRKAKKRSEELSAGRK